MGQITITGLDERVIASLTERAAAAGRTVEDEARAVLLRDAQEVQRRALVEMLEQFRAEVKLPPDWPGSLALLHEGRDEP
ncbi:MAG: hypothetical protein K2X11_05245 [Acetobacteraceae bacterium]|nr:hypothetical protein [Acetobacteraceae bacterium]